GGEVGDSPPPPPGPSEEPTGAGGRPGPDPTPPTRVAPGAYVPAAEEDRPGRGGAGVLLVAGVLVLLLALGALVWALVHSGGDAEAGKSTATTSAPGPASHSAPHSGTAATSHSATTAAPSSTGPGPSPSPSGSATPAQSVKVSLRAVRGSYEGRCPPPDEAAPAVVATVTVGRTPVEVQYRWVTADGESSDPGWKTLGFASGEARTRQLRHVESGDGTAGTKRNAVRFEVRSPVEAASNSVAYAVTCEEETPTGGASSSSSASASSASSASSSTSSASSASSTRPADDGSLRPPDAVTTDGDQAALAKVGR
ncbi:hypothetical protein ABZ389_38130, partial [Streptomyces sp. NPDC005877]